MGTGLAIFLSTFIKGLILAQWDKFKERKAREPIPMKLKNGVYVPWGPVQRIQRILHWMLMIWLVYIAILLVLVAALKLGLWSGF